MVVCRGGSKCLLVGGTTACSEPCVRRKSRETMHGAVTHHHSLLPSNPARITTRRPSINPHASTPSCFLPSTLQDEAVFNRVNKMLDGEEEGEDGGNGAFP